MSNDLDQVLNGLTQQFPPPQPPAAVTPDRRPFIIQGTLPPQESFFARNWPKLLILGVLVLAIVVGIVMYRMSKTKKTDQRLDDMENMDDRLFVQQQQQQQQQPTASTRQLPGRRSRKKVRFQEDDRHDQDQRSANAYYDYQDPQQQQVDFSEYADYETSDMQTLITAPTDDTFRPVSNLQLTPEHQSDPYFDPLPAPDAKLLDRK